jgi:hypothetical protein
MVDRAEHEVVYEIWVQGILDSNWSSWFSGLEVVPEPSGKTRIRGTIADQAALHGILNRVFGLGLTLLSVQRVTARAAKGTEGERNEQENGL